ncbi:MAG: acyl-CoA/acyl-ACP dehydrogenase [Deltaproteobacteria bacterium]|nr:acyl-CoA/acyl-ACP dehydrogenase [Deltaproteobacteria bacterium]
MLVQSARAVARGPVARLVASGARSTHEWTDDKAALLDAYDQSGLTATFLEPEDGGIVEGPKNLALAVVAYELAWVDAGAATSLLAGFLALTPIHERGTPEQREKYLKLAAPPLPGEDRETWRGAFCLTEPIPYVGVDTGMLNGKVRVEEWEDGSEPVLRVDKRGRFITGMAFANFVTLAVDSADERIKGSCMVTVEETDPGTWDRGVPARKMVHQLSSTRDPVFSLRVPASRIIGGYAVKDGVLVPHCDHGEIIGAVFRKSRATVAAMTAAKLLSAVEPVIRYHRNRFRGADGVESGTLRHDRGLQQRQDGVHRLLGVWAMGEASASLALSVARLYDEIEPLEKRKTAILAEKGIAGGMGEMRLFRGLQKQAIEWAELSTMSPEERDAARFQELSGDDLVQYALLDALGMVLCPAAKLWNTGNGTNAMREVVSLMGGYGITEDCPGFLGQKLVDAQLEATYEGPEAVQRRQLGITMANPFFLVQFDQWVGELKRIDAETPDAGAGTLATAMGMWRWTFDHLRRTRDPDGAKLFHGSRQGVTFPLADALCWLVASRQQILDVRELAARGHENPVVAEGLPGTLQFLSDLCHIQAARAAGEVGRICAGLVYGYHRHAAGDAAESCAVCEGLEGFQQLRNQVDCGLTGAQLAKDRAAQALSTVMIPEALDYPA